MILPERLGRGREGHRAAGPASGAVEDFVESGARRHLVGSQVTSVGNAMLTYAKHA
jgi:hypothetical protein